MLLSILLSIILSIIDTITTLIIVLNGGIELNPLCFNINIFIIIKIIVVIGLIVFYILIKINNIKSKTIFWISILFNIIYSIALIHNIIQIINYLNLK